MERRSRSSSRSYRSRTSTAAWLAWPRHARRHGPVSGTEGFEAQAGGQVGLQVGLRRLRMALRGRKTLSQFGCDARQRRVADTDLDQVGMGGAHVIWIGARDANALLDQAQQIVGGQTPGVLRMVAVRHVGER